MTGPRTAAEFRPLEVDEFAQGVALPAGGIRLLNVGRRRGLVQLPDLRPELRVAAMILGDLELPDRKL
jgi:hypothetical protein